MRMIRHLAVWGPLVMTVKALWTRNRGPFTVIT